MRAPLLLVLLLFVASPVLAGELPRAEPAAVGLDPAALAEIDAAVEKGLADKAFPGATVAIARHGKVVYLKSFGTFRDDSIVRIYSMTKPITVAAALILVDEGRLALDDPVSKYIPSFAKLTLHGSDEPPPVMTVRHLMQHTSGLTYGIFGNTPVDRLYREKGIVGKDAPLEDMVDRLSSIPLLYAPGSRWHYSVSTDVLGRVIEVASEQPFDGFLKKRLFEPLGMVDTAFHVPEEKLSRFVPCYGAKSRVIEAVETSRFRTPPKMLSGGGGLVSTAADFLRFTLMLEAGGVWNGERILEAETVKLMTTNGLPDPLVPIRFGVFPLPGMGFGLGVSVQVKEVGPGTREGGWGWAGAASTTFLVSPKDRLISVVLIQRMPLWTGLDRALRPTVLGAVQEEPALGLRFEPRGKGEPLAPRYSPKGFKVELAPHADVWTEGADPLVGHLRLGRLPEGDPGPRLLLARSVEGRPYDRLWVDTDGDGSLEDETMLEARPTERRGSWWTSFEAEVQVGHDAASDAPREPYPIGLWVVVEAEKDAPAFIRFSRRGFLVAPVNIQGDPFHVVLSDSNNDGVYAAGDWWALLAAEDTHDIARSRKVGDFGWAGRRAYRLELEGTRGRVGRLVPHDPGITPEEDARQRDPYWDDKQAERAKAPVAFRHDVDAAIEEAKAVGKPYFLDFETTWCGPCKLMDRWVYTAKDVAEAAEGIVCIKVDGDERKDLKDGHGVSSFPTGILFGADGVELARFAGYRSVVEMAAFFRMLAR